MSMHNLGIPDLPERAFLRHGRSILPQGKGSAPAAPDYAGAAKETAAGNLEAARYATEANRANQYTPWGSLEWTRVNNPTFNQSAYDAALAAYNTPGSGAGEWVWEESGGGANEFGQSGPGNMVWKPAGGGAGGPPNPNDFYTSGGDQWSQTIRLSPEMQALFDQQNRLQQGLFGAQDQALGRVNQMMGQGFDMSALPAMGSDFGAVYDPQRATNNASELLMQRMNPELDRQDEALRARLANQGITQGSSAYNTAMGQFGQQRNDALTQAQLQGIGLGMQQQGLQFNQQNTNQQLQNALRSQAMQEQSYLRNLPLNELNALRTGNQVAQPTFPTYAQQATTGGPDMLGAAQGQYGAQMNAYNAGQAQDSSMMSGLLGIGGLALGGFGAGLFGAAGAGGLSGIGTMPSWFNATLR